MIKNDDEINRDIEDDLLIKEHICDGACMCCPDSDGCEYFDGEHCIIKECKNCNYFEVCNEKH